MESRDYTLQMVMEFGLGFPMSVFSSMYHHGHQWVSQTSATRLLEHHIWCITSSDDAISNDNPEIQGRDKLINHILTRASYILRAYT